MAQLTLQNAVAASGNGTAVEVGDAPRGGVVLELVAGFTGTVVFEGSQDGGTTFYEVRAFDLASGAQMSQTRDSGLYFVATSGLMQVRARYVHESGTLTVKALSAAALAGGSFPVFRMLLRDQTISATGTVTGPVVVGLAQANYLGLLAVYVFTSGTTVSVTGYVQTSFDGGASWFDIAAINFTTTTQTKVAAVTSRVAAPAPALVTDATLANNTVVNGLLGDRLRVKTVTSGTTPSATLKVWGMLK